MAWDNWGNYVPDSNSAGTYLQGSGGGGISLNQSNGGGLSVIQGSSPQLQASNTGTGDQRINGSLDGGQVQGATTPTGYTQEEIAAQQAAEQAAREAAQAAALRGEVTNLVNTIKGIFDQRYGKVDTLAAEQIGKRQQRFGTESADVTRQVGAENEKIGAAHAASGTFDSSYRGNNVDTVTTAGKAQIRDLGTEMQEDINKVGAWVTGEKSGFDANKSGLDSLLGRLAQTTDLNELTSLRAELDGRITELRGGEAAYNTAGQNAQALEKIAPTTAQAVQLKTTLSQILAGNAPSSQKSAIGQALITNSGLSPEEQKALLEGFQGSLAAEKEQEQA